MLGRDDEWAAGIERAHHAHVEDGGGRARRALRVLARPQPRVAGRDEPRERLARPRPAAARPRGGATAWSRGYLLIPAAAELETAANARRRTDRGRGRGDRRALRRRRPGRVRRPRAGPRPDRPGRVVEGLALLDEAMVAVTAGELSPIVTGLVYCSVIDGCQEVYELRRAQEWTEALTPGAAQPDLVAYTRPVPRPPGRDHAAARRVAGRARRGAARARALPRGAAGRRPARRATGRRAARLRGEFGAAEAAYRGASRCGREPQPGLALLRLAQGGRRRGAAIGRVVDETAEPLRAARGCCRPPSRSCSPPATSRRARAACRELERDRRALEPRCCGAMAARRGARSRSPKATRGAALVALRRGVRGVAGARAPYEAARVRVLIGRRAARWATRTARAGDGRGARRVRRAAAPRRTSPGWSLAAAARAAPTG